MKRAKDGEILPVWADILIRLALAIFFAFAAGFYFTNAYAHVMRAGAAHSHLILVLDVTSVLAIGIFSFIVAYLYAIRLQPVNKFAGWIPAITAVLGAFLLWSLMLLTPRLDLSPQVKIFALILILAGNASAILILWYLGKSFSILPESRALVTNGPYRYVRHPLYVAEAISTVGVLISFWSPLAALIVGAQLTMQLARIHYEEKVLRATFPGYAEYSRRTARLIPGIY